MIFGGGLAAAAAPEIPPPMTAEAFRRAFNNASPVQIDIERVVTVTATAAEIEKQWAEIADKPDHPKRMELESARSLAAQPFREQITLTFGGGKWHSKSSSQHQSALEIAGDGQQMWMLSRPRDAANAEGSLTIIAANVPHPQSASIPQLFDHEVLGILARIGNWNIQPQIVEQKNTGKDGNAIVFKLSNQLSSEIRIEKTANRFDSEIWYVHENQLVRGWSMKFTIQDQLVAWPFKYCANQSALYRPDGVVDSLRVIRVEAKHQDELNTLVTAPVVRDSLSVMDFSTVSTSAATSTALSLSSDVFVVWKPEQAVGVSQAGQTFTPTHEAAAPSAVAWIWWVSLLAIAGMLGGSIIVRRWMWS